MTLHLGGSRNAKGGYHLHGDLYAGRIIFQVRVIYLEIPVSFCGSRITRNQRENYGHQVDSHVKVEFELVDGQEERLARVVLTRELGKFRVGIEKV